MSPCSWQALGVSSMFASHKATSASNQSCLCFLPRQSPKSAPTPTYATEAVEQRLTTAELATSAAELASAQLREELRAARAALRTAADGAANQKQHRS